MVDERSDPEPSPRSAERSSGWAINWAGAASLVVIVVVAGLGWRWLDGTTFFASDDRPAAERSETTSPAPASTLVQSAAVTVPSATDAPPTPTTVPTTEPAGPSERRVVISGAMEPCRFGSNCLVASFTIEGFDEHPGRFVCIYPNSRSDFGFGSDGVEGACVTGDAGDTITIEAGGVKSATISETDLDGSTDDGN